MKIVGIAIVALATIGSSSLASAGSSPFCFAGGPTPKHVCDAIKANQKPPATVGSGFTAQAPGVVDGMSRRNSGRVLAR